jgi:hypothetical protein
MPVLALHQFTATLYPPHRCTSQSAAVRTLARRPTAAAARRSLRQIGIIGSDDRIAAPTTTFPNTAVVSMRFEANGAKAGCSASFIAGNVLLTSAHCLYDDLRGYYFSFDSYKFYKANGDMLDANVEMAVVPAQFIQGVSWRCKQCVTLPSMWPSLKDNMVTHQGKVNVR